MMTPISTLIRLLGAVCGGLWAAHRLLVLALLVLPSGTITEVEWVGVPLGGGTTRVATAHQVAARHPGARLILAGTAIEVEAAHRWLADSDLRIESYVVEPGTTHACAVALRNAGRGRPGLLVTDGSHVLRTRLSWALAGGMAVPPVVATSAASRDATEILKTFAYLLRH